MDLINVGTDPWLVEYEACEKVSREIMEHLNSRDSEKVSSQTYDALSAKIRIKLKQFSTEVSELSKKLNLASVVSTMTLEERERRQRQVEALQSKVVQLNEYFSQRKNVESGPSYNKSRIELFEKKGQRPTTSDGGSTAWGGNTFKSKETGTVDEMKAEQERLLEEQNRGLESLLKIISGQKEIATTINDEVEHHNEILVDINDEMERVDRRMNRATDMVKVVGKKENIWGYWLVAFLLLCAILGVAFA